MAENPDVQAWLDFFQRTNSPADDATRLQAAQYYVSQGTKAPAVQLSEEQQSAFDILRETFKSYGLESLVPQIDSFIRKGYSDAQARLALQQTQEFKQRFAGNEALRAAGKNALRIDEYLTVESQMQEVLRQYGMPSAFGERDYLAKLIGNQVSANELGDRVKAASDFVNATPQIVRDQYRTLYGVNESDLTAAFLDPTVAEPIINNRIRMATISGAAITAGVQPTFADQIGQAIPNISYAEAERGFAEAAGRAPRGEQLSAIYGDQYGIEEAQKESFGLAGGVEATATRKKLASKERAAFSGTAAVRAGSLAQETGGI